jgi:hypothetical protein
MAVSTPDKSANRKLAFAGGPEQFGTTDVEKSASHHVSQSEKVVIIPVTNSYPDGVQGSFVRHPQIG